MKKSAGGGDIRIGYPCLNYTLGRSPNSTFRLAGYSRERFIETVGNNLNSLEAILEYNRGHGIGFFRISSDTIPFAGHPVCNVDWPCVFQYSLEQLGRLINDCGMRISMHPDQFVLINAKDPRIVERSISDLGWHVRFLDALGLDKSAKVQIHVGGIYGDKSAAIERFVKNYRHLDEQIRRRLVIENDDRLYSLKDCLNISEQTGIPILFDSFHHECLNNGESLREGLLMARTTWKQSDGRLMVDYSEQEPGARIGKHAQTLTQKKFQDFLNVAEGIAMDVMLEIKDKEKSAARALSVLTKKQRGLIRKDNMSAKNNAKNSYAMGTKCSINPTN